MKFALLAIVLAVFVGAILFRASRVQKRRINERSDVTKLVSSADRRRRERKSNDQFMRE